jgi:hypothetical protein
MKTDIEFSDPYKFLISVGVVLFGLSLLLPWLLLQTSFDASIPASDILKLTPMAQEFMGRRQATALWLLTNTAWISATIALLGSLSVISGLLFWHRRYRQQVEVEVLEEEAKKREALALTPDRYKQIIERSRRALDISSDLDTVSEQDSVSYLSLYFTVAKYQELKVAMARKMRECYEETHRVLTDRQIGQAEYIVLQARFAPNVDAIVGVKYTDQPRTSTWIRDAVAVTAMSAQAYSEEQNLAEPARAVVLFVSPQDTISDSIDKDSILRQAGRLQTQISFDFLKEDKLESLDRKQLTSLVFARPPEPPKVRRLSNRMSMIDGGIVRDIVIRVLWLLIPISLVFLLLYFGVRVRIQGYSTVDGIVVGLILVAVVVIGLFLLQRARNKPVTGTLVVEEGLSGRVVYSISLYSGWNVTRLSSHFLRRYGVTRIVAWRGSEPDMIKLRIHVIDGESRYQTEFELAPYGRLKFRRDVAFSLIR